MRSTWLNKSYDKKIKRPKDKQTTATTKDLNFNKNNG